MRRLLLLVGAIVLVDTMFYAAITPLLPEYAERFGLSKTGAGVLSGAYAAGTLLGSFPSGWLAVRVGSRTTMLIGLALLSVSSVGFAFGHTIELLDAMRFVQGIGGACSWAGGMGWLISTTPAAQRGTTIGAAISAAVAGVLLGPVIGTIARISGPEVPFTTIGVLGALLAVVALRFEAPPRVAATRGFAGAFRDSRVRAGAMLVITAGLVLGTIEVLAPLELDRLGATGIAIGATFLVAAAFEAVAQLVAGRSADRHGRGRPIRIALAGTIAFLLVVPLPQSVLLLAVVVAFGCVMSGALNTPAITVMSDGADGLGLDQGLGFALVNLTWAGGQMGGAIAGGALAGATSDAVAYVALAVICTVALTAVLRAGPRTLIASHAR
jgi:MFS family permease